MSTSGKRLLRMAIRGRGLTLTALAGCSNTDAYHAGFLLQRISSVTRMDMFDRLPPILRRTIALADNPIDVPSVTAAVRSGHDPRLIAAALLAADRKMSHDARSTYDETNA